MTSEPTDRVAGGARHIVLIGMMGSGKSTIGRQLARRSDRSCFDTDALVQERTGRRIQELFASQGEEAFRQQETRVLRDVCSSAAPSIICAGGGTPMRAENREIMSRDATVVWLRARPETLLRRVGDGRDRPMLGTDPAEAIRRLDGLRREVYEATADIIVDVDDATIGEVLERVLNKLGCNGERNSDDDARTS